jgi:hypothetical protein
MEIPVIPIIIAAIFVLVAVGVFLDYRSKSKPAGSGEDSGEGPDLGPRTANEALPTTTGRLKVKEILAQAEQLEAQNSVKEPESKEELEKESSDLPDPFSS